MSGRRDLWILAGMVVVAVLSLVDLARCLPVSARRNDFAHYYLSAKLWLAGTNPYRTNLEPLYAKAGFRYDDTTPVATNPPGLIILFAPLAWLPAGWAFGVWTAAQAAALGWTLWAARRWFGQGMPRQVWWMWVLAVVSSTALFWHFQFAQVQLLLGALLVAAYGCRQRGHEILACVLVVVAAIIKVYPAVMLPWFVWGKDSGWSGRWRRLAVSAVVAGGLVAVTGVGLWRDFREASVPVMLELLTWKQFNFSFPSFVARLGDALMPGQAAVWQTAGMVIGGLTVLAGYGWCVWRRRSEVLQFAGLVIMMVASGLTTWGHYLVLLIVPVTVVVASGAREASRWWWVGLVGMLWALDSVNAKQAAIAQTEPVLHVLMNSVPVAGLVALVVWLTRLKEGRDEWGGRSMW